MEQRPTNLEEVLAGWLGGALLAQTLSKLLLIAATGLVFGGLWTTAGRVSGYLDRKIDEWCATRFHGLKIQSQRILTEQDVSRLLCGSNK